jgi:hypothetical protein
MTATTFSTLEAGEAPVYDSIGEAACMGDHKPVLLSFKLAAR